MNRGEERVFLSTEKVRNGEENKLRYPAELLSYIPETASVPDHELRIKPVCFVMLLRTLQPVNGHLNWIR